MTATQTIETMQPWQIDASHTNVQFSVRHLMISTVRGTFTEVTGTIGSDPADSNATDVRVTIPVASIQTRDQKRDAHLLSPDFFDVANYPEITFIGKRVEGDVTHEFKLIGDLTIRGTTKEFVLDVTNEGITSDPWGNDRMGFSGTGKLNRTAYGLNWNAVLETGGFVVGEDVKLSIDVELVRPKA